MGIYMVGEVEESNKPEIEWRMKEVVSYHHLLLWALNDARIALSISGRAVAVKIDALMALLPPELTEEADIIVKRELDAYDKEALSITHYPVYRLNADSRLGSHDGKTFEDKHSLDEYAERYGLGHRIDEGSLTVSVEWKKKSDLIERVNIPYRLDELYRQYAAYILRQLIELLDDHGLLREFRKEEIGGY